MKPTSSMHVVTGTALALLLALGISGNATASTVCIGATGIGAYTTADATANGADADSCVFESSLSPANPTTETTFVNNSFGGTTEDPFLYIGKVQSSGAFDADGATVGGFTMTVTPNAEGADYGFSYTVVASEAFAGKWIEWVLGVRQGDSFTAYQWDRVRLDISGQFNSYWTPGQGFATPSQAFSHAGGWLRLVDVPEPAALALFGSGLLALGLAVRRRNRVS